MNETADKVAATIKPDTGLACLCVIASFYRIAADPQQIAHDLVLADCAFQPDDIIRGAARIGMKARRVALPRASRLASMPTPVILRLREGAFTIFTGVVPSGDYRIVDPVTRIAQIKPLDELFNIIEPEALLIARKLFGSGTNPTTFGIRWFLPSIWRYRRPLGHVLIASFFIQIFTLITPLFFQIIVDKVLAHKSYSTLIVLIVAIVFVGLFEVLLQYLRSYVLSHTTNRIDVELATRLFRHLLQLPLGYFETRSAGQTVARVRELENIRNFLTGQGLFSVLDLFFVFFFIVVLFFYSASLTMIVLTSMLIFIIIAFILRPLLINRIQEKFNRGAEIQQFLVETIIGINTVKSAAVEPIMQVEWEQRLAAYVQTAFTVTMLSASGQNAIQYCSRVTTAMILLFGSKAVMNNELSLGELIAFNMIYGQATQPILRLSQIWQDFQQVKISIDRLGDILTAPAESRPQGRGTQPPPRGQIEFKNVVFSYGPSTPDVLKNVNLKINAGEVIGIVGASGSGKSTLTKLVQRLYNPQAGQVLLDGADLSQVDPAWLRRHIGVVLQENILFNRTIHDNIAFSVSALTRSQVIAISKLSGAHEFVERLPQGYDTLIEERGSNLSGGQRQRLAIARALACNPSILIFDEATSALDYESERFIQENMRHIVKNRTVIIIAHRLAATRPCNRIITMHEGRVVEDGTHKSLLANPNGLYSRLWALQNSQWQT